MCRMKLKMIWHAPAQLHFLYKVNRIAVEKINKPPMNPLQIKKEEENEYLYLSFLYVVDYYVEDQQIVLQI